MSLSIICRSRERVESVAMAARKVSTAGGAGFGAVGPATGAVVVAAKQSYCH